MRRAASEWKEKKKDSATWFELKINNKIRMIFKVVIFFKS